jgi:hypothetical protein
MANRWRNVATAVFGRVQYLSLCAAATLADVYSHTHPSSYPYSSDSHAYPTDCHTHAYPADSHTLARLVPDCVSV